MGGLRSMPDAGLNKHSQDDMNRYQPAVQLLGSTNESVGWMYCLLALEW